MLVWAPEGGRVCTRWLPRSLRLYWEDDSDTLLVAQVLPQATVLGFKSDGSNCTPWAASAITLFKHVAAKRLAGNGLTWAESQRQTMLPLRYPHPAVHICLVSAHRWQLEQKEV